MGVVTVLPELCTGTTRALNERLLPFINLVVKPDGVVKPFHTQIWV
ncbi:MAG: hypothetical protein QXP29_07820 [Candidatus Nezhaarchaeales archaeon]